MAPEEQVDVGHSSTVTHQSSWMLFVDESSTNTRSVTGLVLTSPEGFKIQDHASNKILY